MATPDYRADHIGSFLRPPDLLRLRAEYLAGRCSLEELRKLEDSSILRVLQMQRETGIDVVSDGEYRRSTFSEALNRVMTPFRVSAPEAVAAQAPLSSQWRGPGAEVIRP